MQKLIILTSVLLFFQVQNLNAQFQEGAIKKRKGEFLLVMVSMGWELVPGQELVIFRNIDSTQKEIGKGKVVKIGKANAVVQITSENLQYKIKKGDWVASDNSDYRNLLTDFKKPRSAYRLILGTGATPLCNLNLSVKQAFLDLQKNKALTSGKAYSDHSLGIAVEYAYQIGKRLKPSISLDYIGNRIRHSEKVSNVKTEVGQQIQNANIMLNLNYYYEEFFEKFKLFAGVGAGLSCARLTATVKSTYPETPEINIDAKGLAKGIRITEQFSMGLEIAFTRSLGLAFEGHYRFRRIRILSRNFSGTNADAQIARIWENSISANEMDFSGGLITVGLVYYR